MKKILFVVLVGIFLVFAVSAFASNVSKTTPMKNARVLSPVLRGDEPLPNAPYYPTRPGLITVSPGDTVGWTQYDYQTNGSSGNRAAIDATGSVHIDWMNGISYPSTRRVYYNYKASGGAWAWPGIGTEVSYRNGDGYCQIDANNDNSGALMYHIGGTMDSLFLAVDAFQGMGIFSYYRPPNRFGTVHLLWPYFSIGNNGNIHVIASQYNATAGLPQIVGYTRSSDGGATWSSLARVDTVMVISTVVTTSPVSNKTAIVYTHMRDTTSQWYNDAYYILSQDGTTWDFTNGKVNVTHYGSGGDSLWAYTDCDAVFDYNDNLHMVWNAQYISPEGSIYFAAKLFHYSTGTGNITQVYQFDSVFYGTGCDFGVWNFTIAKMSIGVDSDNNLFTTYTSWDTTDCSSSGYANGDIYMHYSTDGGATWSAQQNLTNSQTPGCAPGDCDSDHWSSLAEKVDDNLHLTYINDKDPGGIPQTEGSVTDNPVLYLAVANPAQAPSGCPYRIGDINNNGQTNGIDVTYGVGYFKGGNAPPAECHTYCPNQPNPFYAAGDVNGNCAFNGIDITYFVAYLKGGAALRNCPDCPPAQ